MLYFGTPLGWKLTPGLAYKAFLEHFYGPISRARPNAGHVAVARLQAEGKYEACQVVTMNVDGLHQVCARNTQRGGRRILYMRAVTARARPRGVAMCWRCTAVR
jgi:NAD-dependent SIR2 family protein deacetylase